MTDVAADLALARALAEGRPSEGRRLPTGELVTLLLEARAHGRSLADQLVDSCLLPEGEVRARAAAARPLEPPQADGHALGFLLGRGGMGQVWLVLHVASGALRALKRLEPGADAELRLRFVREAQAMARVGEHPALARIHAAGVDERGPWLVMDLLPGGDLGARLAAGPLPPAEVVALGRALARGLAHVHAHGVLHRDLKPSNILFDAAGAPRLADFGTARLHDSDALTVTGSLLGTPAYMAPEQALGAGGVDERADVWGLGAVLYHAVTGRLPFEGATPIAIVTRILDGGPPDPPSRHAPGCPAALDQVLLRALARDPGARFATAADLAAALDAVDAAPAPPARGGLGLGLVALVLAALAALVGRVSPSVAPTPPRERPTDAGATTSAPARRLVEAELLARVGQEEGPAVLDELAAVPAAELPWRAAAAALLVLEGDPERAAAWRARAGTLTDPAAARTLALAAGEPPPSGRQAGDLGQLLPELDRACQTIRSSDAQAADIIATSQVVQGLPDLLRRAPEWARQPLAIRAQRALVDALDGVVNSAPAGPARRPVLVVVRQVAQLAPRSRAQGPLRVLGLMLEPVAGPERSEAGLAELDAIEPLIGAAGGARAARALVVLRGMRLRLAPNDAERRPDSRARLLAGWAQLLADGRAAGLLDEVGRPTARLADGTVVVRERSVSSLARSCEHALQRAAVAAAFEAWERRLSGDAAGAHAEALRLARMHAAHRDDGTASWSVARALLVAGDVQGASEALRAAPTPVRSREKALHAALLVEAALAAGDDVGATYHVNVVQQAVANATQFDLSASEVAQLSRLLAVMAEAVGEPGLGAQSLAQAGAQDLYVSLPWRTAAETDRHIRLLRRYTSSARAWLHLLREPL